jgi:hypothetical protein
LQHLPDVERGSFFFFFLFRSHAAAAAAVVQLSSMWNFKKIQNYFFYFFKIIFKKVKNFHQKPSFEILKKSLQSKPKNTHTHEQDGILQILEVIFFAAAETGLKLFFHFFLHSPFWFFLSLSLIPSLSSALPNWMAVLLLLLLLCKSSNLLVFYTSFL